MNREETIEAIKVMQAYVDGEEVITGVGVNLIERPLWDWAVFTYTVKPKPREIWVNVYADGMVTYQTEESAKHGLQSQGETTKFIEVIDD